MVIWLKFDKLWVVDLVLDGYEPGIPGLGMQIMQGKVVCWPASGDLRIVCPDRVPEPSPGDFITPRELLGI